MYGMPPTPGFTPQGNQQIRANLRPYSILEILDRTFRIYREYFTSFFGLVAVIIVPVTLLSFFFGAVATSRYAGLGFDPNDPSAAASMSSEEASRFLGSVFGSLGVVLLIAIVLAFIQTVVLNGTLTYMTSEAHLGRRIGIREALGAASRRFGSLTGGLLLYGILIVALSIGIGCCFSTAFSFLLVGSRGGGGGTIIGLIVYALVLAIIFYVAFTLYAFLTPVMILERIGVTEGISRGWYLAKSRFWAVLGVSMLIGFISLVFTYAIGLLEAALGAGTVQTNSFSTANIVGFVLQTIVTIFIAPLVPIASTLLYYDTRVRLEGLDIALSNLNTPEPRPSDLLSPPPSSRITGNDALNVILLIVIFVIFIFVIGLIFAGAASILRPPL